MDTSTLILKREAIQVRMEQRRSSLGSTAPRKTSSLGGLVGEPILKMLFASAAGGVVMPIVRQIAFAGATRMAVGVLGRLGLDRFLPRRKYV